MNRGKIIVIDGLDGCGKSTQLEIAEKKLLADRKSVRAISFPDYKSQSSALVKMYLEGEFSDDPNDVNAYAASSFYAVDRYASYMKYWKKDYESGKIILAARYVSSNAIHQMVKLDENCFDAYLNWLYDYEHEKLGLPLADKVIFLDMPTEISQKLLSKRYNGEESRKDIHEAHIEYLRNCRRSALYAAKRLGWTVIGCSDGETPLPVETISEKIMEEISKVVINA